MNESMPELMRRLCFEHNQLRVPGSPAGAAWERAMIDDVAQLIESKTSRTLTWVPMTHFISRRGNASQYLEADRKYAKATQEAGINVIC